MHDSHQNIQILWKTYIYPLYLPVRLTPLTLPLYTPSLHSFVYYAALHCTGTAQLPLGYPLVTKKPSSPLYLLYIPIYPLSTSLL